MNDIEERIQTRWAFALSFSVLCICSTFVGGCWVSSHYHKEAIESKGYDLYEYESFPSVKAWRAEKSEFNIKTLVERVDKIIKKLEEN